MVGVGQKVTVYITGYDDYGNRVTTGGDSALISVLVSNQNDPTDIIPAGITDNGDGTYAVGFVMSRVGTYKIIFRFQGVSVQPASYISVRQSLSSGSLLPQFSVPLTTPAGYSGSYLQVTAGQQLLVTVITPAQANFTAFADQVVNVTLTYSGKATPDWYLMPAMTSDGRRVITLQLTQARTYVMDILADGISIPGGPWNVLVQPQGAAKGSVCDLTVNPGCWPVPNMNVNSSTITATLTAGNATSMYIFLYDTYGNLATPDVVADVYVRFDRTDGFPSAVASLALAPTAVGWLNGTAVQATFTLTTAGTYYPKVYYRSMLLCAYSASSTFGTCMPALKVVPADPSPSGSVLYGTLLAPTVKADVATTLRLLPYDAYGNALFGLPSAGFALPTLPTVPAYSYAIVNAATSATAASGVFVAAATYGSYSAAISALATVGTYTVTVTQTAPT